MARKEIRRIPFLSWLRNALWRKALAQSFETSIQRAFLGCLPFKQD